MNDLLAGLAANPIVDAVILGIGVGGAALWMLAAWCPWCAAERDEPVPEHPVREQQETPDIETAPDWVPLGAGGLADHRAAAAMARQ